MRALDFQWRARGEVAASYARDMLASSTATQYFAWYRMGLRVVTFRHGHNLLISSYLQSPVISNLQLSPISSYLHPQPLQVR